MRAWRPPRTRHRPGRPSDPARSDAAAVARASVSTPTGAAGGEAVGVSPRQARTSCAAPRNPLWRRILAQFTDPLIVLLLAAVVISVVAWVIEGAEGLPIDAIVILAIILLNAVLGLIQEARAENAVAALPS